MTTRNFPTAAALVAAACFGAGLYALVSGDDRAVMAQATGPATDIEALKSEIESIKERLPDQAHAMQDVGYHFSNVWFAAQKENWPLAAYYNQETLSHLHWAVRIIPKRKDNAGVEIDLVAILQAFENSPWKQLQEAIMAKDRAAFDTAYRFSIETCYACHKASDKPFIRPRIPSAPETAIINFEPGAKWPQ